MKHIRLYLLAVGSALLAAAASLYPDAAENGFLFLSAFPFLPVARLLELLSGTGFAGNLLAWPLLTLISCLPLLLLPGARTKAGRVTLIVLALQLFATLWCMMNPAFLVNHLPLPSAGMLPTLQAVMGGALWATIVCAAVLRLLDRFSRAGWEQLLGWLERFLYALCILFAAAGGLQAGSLPGALQDCLYPAATVPVELLRLACAMLPYALDVAVTVKALDLLRVLRAPAQEDAPDEVVPCAQRLLCLCRRSLAAVTFSGAACNLLQLLVMPLLTNVHTTLTIPVVSLAFVLAAYLFARLIAENRQLSRDNGLFI